MKTKQSFWGAAGGFLANNNVTALFAVLCVAAFFASGYTLSSLFDELFIRLGRNTFLVLSLLIPVVAGLGLNFGIVIGAIAAQISIFLVVLWGFTGFGGILMCMALCTPLAIFFGWLVGKLFNSMKGTEMVGGLVSGYFSDGLYQLLFLFILGGVIPINNKDLMISTGVGVKNVINLDDSLKYAVDNIPMLAIVEAAFFIVTGISALLLIMRAVHKKPLLLSKVLRMFVPVALLYALSYIPAVFAFLSAPRLILLDAVEFGVLLAVLYNLYDLIRRRRESGRLERKWFLRIAAATALYGLSYIPQVEAALRVVRLPVLTYLSIVALCLFIPWFMSTKLGQDMRTVGQDRAVATSSGINVDRVRVIAMIMSTVLASYGQIISLQNIGTVATYGSHVAVGLYAIAALLVGGASVQRATTTQAVLGVILFHTLFILSPTAGTNLFGNAQIGGEYFRLFVAYGVIAVTLAMHAWKKRQVSK